MSQERTEAVVLSGVDFSETSRIVTFLTPGRGRLACMAKGVRRKQSPLSAALDTLNRLELVYYWKDGRSVQPLGEAALLDRFSAIKADLEKSAFAMWPLELAGKIVHENEPSEVLYAALVSGMERLCAWPGDARTHACWQVIQLLSAAGFEPSLEACATCGVRVRGGRVDGAPGFSYDGGVVCKACRADRRLSAEEYACLCALIAAQNACPPGKGPGGVYAALCRYAARQVEADFRSVRVIDQMFK